MGSGILKAFLNRHTGLKRGIRLVVPAVLLFFVVRYLFHDTAKIQRVLTEVSPLWVLAAFICYFTGVGIIGINWRRLLAVLGAECDMQTALKSYYYSQLAKYVPGRVWGATGRIVLLRGASIPEGTAALGILLESVILMVSASIVGLLALGSYGRLPLEVRCLAIASPFILLLLHPAFMHRAVRAMARRFPKHVMYPETLPGFRYMVILAGRYCGVWLFQGLGFWCAVHSLVPIKSTDVIPVIGGNALAWLAGFVVVFTPAGLGVRELVLTRLNSGRIGVGPAALAAFIARILVILSELLGAGLIWLRRRCSGA